jgi:hypothetical protein
MSVAYAELAVELPDSPYRMWIDGTLGEHLPLPDGYRVEIIGGEMIISPGAPLRHNVIISDIIESAAAHPAFRAIGTTGLDLEPIQDAYIPDVVLIDRAHARKIHSQGVRYILPSDIAMAIEITSATNARRDRAPGPQPVRADGSYPKCKWTGYARCGIPFYLVVDCDPKVARSLLYSNPDAGEGSYLEVDSRPLGEPIRLPDPIGLTIPTDQWRTWS